MQNNHDCLSTGPSPNSTAIPSSTTSTIPKPRTPLNVTIQPVTAATLPTYRRLITTLLPIRYQDKYYAESIVNPTSSSLALCAIWHDPAQASSTTTSNSPSSTTKPSKPSKGKEKPEGILIGGIQCRLEPCSSSSATSPFSSPAAAPNSLNGLSSASTSASIQHQQQQQYPQTKTQPQQSSNNNENTTTTTNGSTNKQLYISTLLTSPAFRTLGVATSLLNHIVHTLLTHPAYAGLHISRIYAHVWEANADGLQWYKKRGFLVDAKMLDGYYRKLKPSGAWVVWRSVGGRVGEWVHQRGWNGLGHGQEKERRRDGNVVVGGDLKVEGTEVVNGDLKVGGNLMVVGTLQVNGNLRVSGNLEKSGYMEINGDTYVSGDIN